MLIPKKIYCYLFVVVVIFVVSGCGGIWDRAVFSPTTAMTKKRHYDVKYDFAFKAAYQAAQKTGLRVTKLDPQMGAIIASESIGAYSSGWSDRYVIFLQAKGDNKTLVQVKYQPVREGAVFTSLSSPRTAQSTSSVGENWHNSTMKVNRLFDRIQRELGIVDIIGIRGLLE